MVSKGIAWYSINFELISEILYVYLPFFERSELNACICCYAEEKNIIRGNASAVGCRLRVKKLRFLRIGLSKRHSQNAKCSRMHEYLWLLYGLQLIRLQFDFLVCQINAMLIKVQFSEFIFLTRHYINFTIQLPTS